MQRFNHWMKNEGIGDWPKKAWNFIRGRNAAKPQQLPTQSNVPKPLPKIDPKAQGDSFTHALSLFCKSIGIKDINQKITTDVAAEILFKVKKDPSYLSYVKTLLGRAMEMASGDMKWSSMVDTLTAKKKEINDLISNYEYLKTQQKTTADWQRLANEPNAGGNNAIEYDPNPNSKPYQDAQYKMGKKEIYVLKAIKRGEPEQEIIQNLINVHGIKTPTEARRLIKQVRERDKENY